jgi:arsenate reductase
MFYTDNYGLRRLPPPPILTQTRRRFMAVTIYHNPRCSKSRQTLKLLQDRKVSLEIVEYLKTPPNAKTLADILDRLGMEPRQLMRKKEAPYKAKKLDDVKLTRKQLIDAMVADPVLIERPIVLAGKKAALGRPPESVLDIL